MRRATIIFVFLLAVFFCPLHATAQGIVGLELPKEVFGREPVSPYGYETARDISRIVTGITLLIVFFVPLAERKKERIALLITELLGLSAIPVLVHLAGIYIINNFAGLGGGV